VQPGDRITYTVEIHADTTDLTGASVVDPIPTGTTFAGFGVNPIGATYDGTNDEVEWSGTVTGGSDPVTFTFGVDVDLSGWSISDPITNTVVFDSGAGLVFTRTAVSTLDFPDPSPSVKTVDKDRALEGDVLTYTIRVENASSISETFTLRDPIPANTTYVPGSLTYTVGTAAYDPGDDAITWTGTVISVPKLLLVDDDDNTPDVLPYYTTALDALGAHYDVWDTGNSDNEPDATTLSQYACVIWFTGDEYGGYAGPGPAGEAALGTYLDSGGRLFISSQDYLYDRGLTPFIQTYLGVSSYTGDVHHATVTGAGTVYGGYGPYALTYPSGNWSDSISPDGTAEVAFTGDSAPPDAAVDKDNGTYRTTFWGFPFEALPSAGDHEAMLRVTLQWFGCLQPLHELEFAVTTASPLPVNTWITNTATITGSLNVVERSAGTLVNPVDLSASVKMADKEQAMVNEVVTYDFLLQNTGLLTATGAVLTDAIPANTTYVPGSVACGSGACAYDPGGDAITWSGDIVAGSPITLTFAVTLTTVLPDQTPVINTATLDDGFGNLYDLEALFLARSSNLSASFKQAVPDQVERGGTVTYTVYIYNSGGVAVVGEMRDELPAGLTYVPGSLFCGSGSCGEASGVISWTGTVPPRSMVPVRFQVTVSTAAIPGTQIINTATVTDTSWNTDHPATETITVRYFIDEKIIYLPLVLRNF
jgi:uncharacterized repeat protein (TIGR01451 family)